jgi:hypothetical protein
MASKRRETDATGRERDRERERERERERGRKGGRETRDREGERTVRRGACLSCGGIRL